MYNFGDTFAHDESRNFVGATSSTMAIAAIPQSPEITSYPDVTANGAVASFIPLIKEEQEWEDHLQQFRKRATLWCFGGILQSAPILGNVCEGWTFFQKSTHVSY
jgi:hypothetical protein